MSRQYCRCGSENSWSLAGEVVSIVMVVLVGGVSVSRSSRWQGFSNSQEPYHDRLFQMVIQAPLLVISKRSLMYERQSIQMPPPLRLGRAHDL